MQPRVHVTYAGGTIGMMPTDAGFAPAPGTIGPRLAEIVARSGGALPEVGLLELDPLIDSANATPATWLDIASTLDRLRDSYDGFVVLHGTDTMAYTASALSFLLPAFGKPVVVTGSQVPLVCEGSDGYANLEGALRLAAAGDVREVCLLFGKQVLRGNRATKIDANGPDAFASPSAEPLATADAARDLSDTGERVASTAAYVGPRACAGAHVAAIRLFPGIEAGVISNVCRSPLQGLVIEAYGAGNGPADDPKFLAALRHATSRGLVAVVVTQCLHGAVVPGAYAAGSALLDAGATPGYDMTTEAALTKLWVLLAEGRSAAEVRALMTTDLAGELTQPPAPDAGPGACPA